MSETIGKDDVGTLQVAGNGELAILTPTTELAIPDGMTSAVNATQEQFQEVITTYLPRLMLFDASSNAVKEDIIKAGNYGLQNNNQIIDLGRELNVFNLSWRLKALTLVGQVRSYFNIRHPMFQEIKAKSAIPNSQGYLCGAEFLVYIPQLKRFATFYMASKTMRREADNMVTRIKKAVTLKSRLIDNGKHKWWGPLVTSCSVNLEPPPNDKMMVELNKFNSPPEQEVEKATEPERAR